MENTSVYKDYLLDLGVLLKEMAFQAKEKVRQVKDKEEIAFQNGYLMGFHRVLTLMVQQAEGFQIPLKEIGLDGIDPDDDLMP